MLYWLCVTFLIWVIMGVVLKSKTPIRTFYRKFAPPKYKQERVQYKRFDLE